MGRNKVMQVALGRTPVEEYKAGTMKAAAVFDSFSSLILTMITHST